MSTDKGNRPTITPEMHTEVERAMNKGPFLGRDKEAERDLHEEMMDCYQFGNVPARPHHSPKGRDTMSAQAILARGDR